MQLLFLDIVQIPPHSAWFQTCLQKGREKKKKKKFVSSDRSVSLLQQNQKKNLYPHAYECVSTHERFQWKVPIYRDVSQHPHHDLSKHFTPQYSHWLISLLSYKYRHHVSIVRLWKTMEDHGPFPLLSGVLCPEPSESGHVGRAWCRPAPKWHKTYKNIGLISASHQLIRPDSAWVFSFPHVKHSCGKSIVPSPQTAKWNL